MEDATTIYTGDSPPSVAEVADRFLAVEMARPLSRERKQAIRAAVAALVAHRGEVPAAAVTAEDYRSLRSYIVTRPGRSDLSRLAASTVNGRMGTVREVFRWGASERIVPDRIYLAMMMVDDWPEPNERPQPDLASVEATLPYLAPHLRAAVRFQVLIGARAAGVLSLRPCDIDRSHATPTVRARCRRCRKGAGPCEKHADWFYQASGTRRVIRICPRAQAILAPYLDRPAASFAFSPRDGDRFRYGRSRTRMGAKVLRDRYRCDTYAQAIRNAVDAARGSGLAVRPWTSDDLRLWRGSYLPEPPSSEDESGSGLVPFSDVAERFPWTARGGEPPAVGTVANWHHQGRRGRGAEAGEVVHLRAVRLGFCYLTREEWLREFFGRVGWPTDYDPPPGLMRTDEVAARVPWAQHPRNTIQGWIANGLICPSGQRVKLRGYPHLHRIGTTEAALREFYAAMGWPTDAAIDPDLFLLSEANERCPWLADGGPPIPYGTLQDWHQSGRRAVDGGKVNLRVVVYASRQWTKAEWLREFRLRLKTGTRRKRWKNRLTAHTQDTSFIPPIPDPDLPSLARA